MADTTKELREQINKIIKSNVLKALDGEVLAASGNIICIPLIAAAPQMYEALKALVEYQDKYGGVVPSMLNAKEALAKAEEK